MDAQVYRLTLPRPDRHELPVVRLTTSLMSRHHNRVTRLPLTEALRVV
jgi:hypothetical protein